MSCSRLQVRLFAWHTRNFLYVSDFGEGLRAQSKGLCIPELSDLHCTLAPAWRTTFLKFQRGIPKCENPNV